MLRFKKKLRNPEPDLLKEIARMLFRPNLIVNGMLARPNVSFWRLHKTRPLEQLPECIESEKEREVDVRSEEAASRERPLFARLLLDEDVKAIEEDDDGEEDEGEVGGEGLELALEDHGIAIDILSNQSSSEPNVSDADGDPCEKLSNSDKILEP